MVDITRQNIDLNPTMRFTDVEGRLTGEAFRFMSELRRIIKAVNIVDGEITTEMLADLAVKASKLDDGAVVIGKLAAGSIYVSTLFADAVVITNTVAPKAITDITVGVQVSPVGPFGEAAVSALVPITSTNNTGVLVTFTAFMNRPNSDPSNFGYWFLYLYRNGVPIDRTPDLYYDDNFAYPVVASFVDLAPGSNPTYTIVTGHVSGNGAFTIVGGLLNCSLLKR